MRKIRARLKRASMVRLLSRLEPLEREDLREVPRQPRPSYEMVALARSRRFFQLLASVFASERSR
jgi:hypothetical protein